MAKKYYWLKLRRDFFKRHDTQIIESMPNGKEYILFYLKLLVESIDHEGNLRFSETIPYNEQMLSSITNTNIDIVRSAVKVFTQLGMMDCMDDGTLHMAQVKNMIGDETEWAEKKRLYRENKETIEGQKRTMSDKSIELDKEIDIEINNTKSHSPSGGDDNALVLHKPNSPAKKEPKRTEEEKTIFASIWQQTIKDHGIELIKTQSGREAKACWDLVDLSSKQFAGMALDGVSSIITSFLDKKRNDRTTGGFWRDKSPRPSTILAMWPQLLETIREKTMTPEEQDLLKEMTEAMTKYDR
jgi:predicted phage replisome organizer